MKKIKVISVHQDDNSCYDCGRDDYYYNNVIDWQEVDDKTYYELIEAIRINNKNSDKKFAVVVLYENTIINTLLMSAKTFKEKLEQQEKDRLLKIKKQKEAKDAANLARKQKQLEKLKKELGE